MLCVQVRAGISVLSFQPHTTYTRLDNIVLRYIET